MPVNTLISIALALMPLPAMKMLDYLNRGCGDGLCGFFSGLLILGGLAVATVIFVIRSTHRNEANAALRLLPFLLWLAALYPMFV